MMAPRCSWSGWSWGRRQPAGPPGLEGKREAASSRHAATLAEDTALSCASARGRRCTSSRTVTPLAFEWTAARGELEVPTVAAVSGPAVGAGFALALACDLRFVAEDARLSVPFTRLGMHPGMLTTWSLPRVAGVAVARDLLLTGRAIDGVEAVRLGIAGRALPAGEVLAVALQTPRGIPANAPVATRLTELAP